MTLMVCEDGSCNHTGSVCSPTAGTLTAGSNSHVTINDQLVMVEDGTMEIPGHLLPDCINPDGPHSFNPDTLAQSHITINDKKVVLLGDSYGGDATDIDSAGSNSHVEVY